MSLHQRDRQGSRNLKRRTFCKLPVASAQCITGTEKYPDALIWLNFYDDDFSQGCGQINEAFRALTKSGILQPYISDDDFRSSNVRADDVGYTLYVFDEKNQKHFTTAQAIKVEFEFDGAIPNDINRYALVLKNKWVSISSEGQRHFVFS